MVAHHVNNVKNCKFRRVCIYLVLDFILTCLDVGLFRQVSRQFESCV